MRKVGWLAVIGVVALAMFLGGPVTAKTNKLEATFDGDTNASFSVKVKTNKKGKPKQATAIRYSGMPILCNGVTTEVSGTMPNRKVSKSDDGPTFFSKYQADPVYVSVIAYMNAKGTKIHTGEITTINTDTAACAGERRVILTFTAK
jgi:hypothetical protein